MAKPKALIAAEARIAALEAQLSVARTCYRALRDSIVMPAHVENRTSTSSPIVTRFFDGVGREWIKTRIGNRASSRLA